MTPRPPTILVVAAALAVALTGCATPSSDATGPATLVVRDGALRAVGSDCAGSGPYLFVHAGATVAAVDDAGTLTATMTLSPGTARPADDRDYGTAKRVPTVCEFALDDLDFADIAGSELRVDDRALTDVSVAESGDGTLTVSYPAVGDPTGLTGGAP